MSEWNKVPGESMRSLKLSLPSGAPTKAVIEAIKDSGMGWAVLMHSDKRYLFISGDKFFDGKSPKPALFAHIQRDEYREWGFLGLTNRDLIDLPNWYLPGTLKFWAGMFRTNVFIEQHKEGDGPSEKMREEIARLEAELLAEPPTLSADSIAIGRDAMKAIHEKVNVGGYFTADKYNKMVDRLREGPCELDNAVARLKAGLEVFLGYSSDLNNVEFDEEGLWVGGPPPDTFPTTVLYTLAKAQWRYDEGYKGWWFGRRA